jgi:hypothetical protein
MSRDPKDRDALVPMPSAPVQQHQQHTDDQVAPETPSGWMSWIDRAISVQRPVVVAHVNALRRRHPDAQPAQIIEILERQYLTAVTSGGAAVGASAVIPGVGLVTSLGLSGAETVGFLEASALFAQSVTEVHGIAVEDPDRARALVMAMMLGAPGTQLVKQLAAQAGGGQARTAFWGELVTSSLPKSVVSGIGGKLRSTFVKRFVTRPSTDVPCRSRSSAASAASSAPRSSSASSPGRARPCSAVRSRSASARSSAASATTRSAARSSRPPAARSGRRPCTSRSSSSRSRASS